LLLSNKFFKAHALRYVLKPLKNIQAGIASELSNYA